MTIAADPAIVHRLFLLALVACKPYIAASYDTAPKVTGPVAPATPTARAPDAQSIVPPNTHNYSLEVGGGARDFTIDLGLHLHDVGGDYAGSSSLDFAVTPLRLGRLSARGHVGPALFAIIDPATGAHSVAQGFRYGVGGAVTYGRVGIYADWSRTGLVGDTGFGALSGVSIGLTVR